MVDDLSLVVKKTEPEEDVSGIATIIFSDTRSTVISAVNPNSILEGLNNDDVVTEQAKGSIFSIIEHSILSLTAKENDKVVGFFALSDIPHPSLSLIPTQWEYQILPTLTTRNSPTMENTLWCELFAISSSSKTQTQIISHQLLSAIFTTLPELDNILIKSFAGPPLVPLLSDSKVFVPIIPKKPTQTLTPAHSSKENNTNLKPEKNQEKEKTGKSLPSVINNTIPLLFHVTRDVFIPQLTIRAARVEDHDDLVPLFNQQTEVTPSVHDEYFLAHLIESQDRNHRVLVAEVNKRAVGLMALTTSVDVEVLKRCFHLEPYSNFVNPNNPNNPNNREQLRIASATKKKDGKNESIDNHTAFCVTLFCVLDTYSSRARDFLQPALSVFPGKEYLLITQPHSSSSNALLPYFTQVSARSGSTFPHVLYLLHQSSLSPTVTRNTQLSDLKPISNFVNQVERSDEMLDMLNTHLNSTHQSSINSWLLLCEEQIVGFAITNYEADSQWLRENYELDDFIVFEHHHSPNHHAFLLHFVLNPIFDCKRVYFLREIMRKMEKSCLYYRVYYESHVSTVISSMFPVQARKQVHYPTPAAQGIHPTSTPHHSQIQSHSSNQPFKHEMHTPYVHPIPPPHVQPSFITPSHYLECFALYVTCKKLLQEQKITVNSRILVVGASDVSLSFLETLCKVPYINFTNLTILSPGGIIVPGSNITTKIPNILPESHCYQPSEFVKLGMTAHLTIVDGKMVTIDRNKKIVMIDNGGLLRYDFLILATGIKDKTPKILFPVSETEREPPKGLISLSGHSSLLNAFDILLSELEEHKKETDKRGEEEKPLVYNHQKVVIYSNVTDLEPYTVLQGLMTLGANSHDITIVLTSSNEADCFRDAVVESEVGKALKHLGVKIIKGYSVKSVECNSETGDLEFVLFEKDDGDEADEIRLECSVMLSTAHKDVDMDAFQAINESCLIYDGRLVIDHSFRTNDPSIYAAGSLTKFARRYRPAINLSSYNSRKVGEKVAQSLLSIIDPFSFDDDENQFKISLWNNTSHEINAIKKHSVRKVSELGLSLLSPKSRGGILPHNLHFLDLEMPNPHFESRTESSRNHFVTNTLTGEGMHKKGRYMCLSVDNNGLISRIVYLGTEPIEVSNIQSLMGLPLSSLNSLQERYEQGLITDLVLFFRQPWSMALYHDRFEEFRNFLGTVSQNEQVLSHLIDKVSINLHTPQKQPVKRTLSAKKSGNNNNRNATTKETHTLKDILQSSKKILEEEKDSIEAHQFIQQKLFDFLRHNHTQLRMHYVPLGEPSLTSPDYPKI